MTKSSFACSRRPQPLPDAPEPASRPRRAAPRGRGLALLVLGAALVAPVGAQTGAPQALCADKPLRFVVGFAPGSSIDAVARIVADALRARSGQAVHVDNKPGANGILAATEVAKAAPDGCTLLMSNSSTITVNPLLYKKLSYDVARDFAPVALVVTVPFILTVNPTKDPSIKTLPELLAKARAQPGRLSYGSAGLGNLTQLSFEILNRQAGVQMVHVPYKGSAPAQLAVLAGEVDAAFDNPAAMAQIRAGKLRALAVTSAERWRDLPDVPAVAESGYKGFDISFWVGALAPGGTPKAVVERLSEAIRGVASEPAVRTQLQAQGNLLMLAPGPFSQRIQTETAQYAEVVKAAGIQLD